MPPSLQSLMKVQVLILLWPSKRYPYHHLHTCMNLFPKRYTMLFSFLCFLFVKKFLFLFSALSFLNSTSHIGQSLIWWYVLPHFKEPPPCGFSKIYSFVDADFLHEFNPLLQNFLNFLFISARSSLFISDSSFLVALSPWFFSLFTSPLSSHKFAISH